MKVTRSSLGTARGPASAFSGEVFVDAVAEIEPPSRVAASLVHFMPAGRTHWHTHPVGQTIFVTEGVGRCQRAGGPVLELHPGDRVFFEPGESHWHGAAPNRLMVHVAIQEAGEDGASPVTWGEAVTDEQYAVEPKS
jgi:quercetin dioxygenase-like cupin family protein